jgi:hypothetical protein
MSEIDAGEDAAGLRFAERPAAPPSITQPSAGPPAFTPGPSDRQVAFDRQELRVIFELYGRKVAAGEWRDYAMDFLKDRAVFSVYRRTAEFPLYRIEKTPRLARRQGAFSVIAPQGLILKRGHDLAQVLRVLDKPVRLVVD